MVILQETKKVIAFDIDGVVTETKFLADLVAKKLNIQFEYEKHLNHYHIEKCLREHGFISAEEEFDEPQFFHEIDPELYLNSPMREGFLEIYNRLKEEGHEIHFITARKSHYAKYTYEFFNKSGLGEVPRDNIHHVNNPESKHAILKELGVDVLFEDNLSTGLKFLEDDADRVLYIMAEKYNEVEDNERIHRINGWHEFK